MIKKTLFVLLMVSLLVACQTGENAEIQINQSKDEEVKSASYMNTEFVEAPKVSSVVQLDFVLSANEEKVEEEEINEPQEEIKEKEHVESESKRPEIETSDHSESFVVHTDANVREYPSVNDGDSIDVLPRGKEVEAFEKSSPNGTTWYHVQYDSKEGWMSGVVLTDEETYQKEVEQAQKEREQAQASNNESNQSSSNSSSNNQYQPNTIYYGNKAVPYKNAGRGNAQHIIDTSQYASTDSYNAVFSGTDGENTLFVGHNGGRNQFGGMHNHSEFVVTDSNGKAFKYCKTRRYVVDEYAIGQHDGVDYWDRIVGNEGGVERITLQNTKNHPYKWIVEAEFCGRAN